MHKMHRDFKMGLAVGIVAAAAAAVWFSTRPYFSTESRALRFASPPPAVSPEIPQPAQPIQPSNSVQPAQSQSARFYIVQKGDTLSAISQKYYGTTRFWQKILAANDAVLKDPDRLVPGTRLLIPD
jgi:nucleoid-associated protein YgaU